MSLLLLFNNRGMVIDRGDFGYGRWVKRKTKVKKKVFKKLEIDEKEEIDKFFDAANLKLKEQYQRELEKRLEDLKKEKLKADQLELAILIIKWQIILIQRDDEDFMILCMLI